MASGKEKPLFTEEQKKQASEELGVPIVMLTKTEMPRFIEWLKKQ